ncbi:hypothetical protein HJG60_008144 [Phyllostomus discolor]|uniref:Uncharacterized protein n=1 Tax=Phyllostomus discolor TaxID=89673 RepID=A0A833Z868_9CHIR|nr:hypothetical protein HJG60_008144 [Phyllostomus discolor]
MHSWPMSVFPGRVQGRGLWLRLFPCLPHSLAPVPPPAGSPLDRYILQARAEAHTGNALKGRAGICRPSCILESQNVRAGRHPKASGPTLLIYKMGNRDRRQETWAGCVQFSLDLVTPFSAS